MVMGEVTGWELILTVVQIVASAGLAGFIGWCLGRRAQKKIAGYFASDTFKKLLKENEVPSDKVHKISVRAAMESGSIIVKGE